MKKSFISGLSLLCLVVMAPSTVLAASCADGSSPTSNKTALYTDNFDQGSFSTNNWYYRITGVYPTGGNGGLNLASNVSSSASGLAIKMDWNGTNFTGGGIISRHLFGYGYYEIYAQNFDAFTGFHESFWSMGIRYDIPGAGGDSNIDADINNGNAPYNNQITEIDGYELQSATHMDMGNQKQSVDTNVIRHGNTGTTGYTWPGAVPSDFGGWHTYGYDWEPDNIRFFIDGVCQLQVPTTTNNIHFAPQNFWLTALKNAPNGGSGFPKYMIIKNFKYYTADYLGVNLLANPAFDVVTYSTGSFSTQNPPGWIQTGTTSATYLESSDVLDGTYALSQYASTAYGVSTKQRLEYIANGTYTLSAWVKSSGNPTYSKMRVLGFDSSGTEMNVDIPRNASNWTHISIYGIPVSNHSATVLFTTNSNGGDWVHVEDAAFTESAP